MRNCVLKSVKMNLSYLIVLFSVGLANAAQPAFSNVCTPPCKADEGELTQTPAGMFNVVDPDAGTITLCAMISGPPDKFDIQQDGGDPTLFHVILLANAGLDYAVAQDYTIVVNCTDSAGEWDIQPVQVDVIPNQPPTITAQTGGAYSVSENDNAQTELEAFTVTDPEGDDFSCIIASVTPPVTGTFGLWTDPTDYKLFLETNPTLDAAVGSHDVDITCSDAFGSTSVVITVAVTGNVAPAFDPGSYTTTINANNKNAGENVFSPAVTDSDNGPNALSYSMVTTPTSTRTLFNINPVSGEITAATDMGYTTEATYALTVNVSDGQDWTIQQVTVNVNNFNTPPIITNLPTQVFFSEYTAGNTNLERLTISDPDGGDPETVTWSVVDPATGIDYTYKFDYNANSRQFSLAAGESFDYETVPSYIATFYVADDWDPTGPYDLTITVTNENEQCEFSADTYHVSIYENNTVGVDPGIIVTDDGTYWLDLAATAHSPKFSLLSGNNITFAIDYDRDLLHPWNVTLWIVCTDDAGVTNTATLSVSILDVNDHIPEFAQTGYIFNVDQYDFAGEYITTIAAVDYDYADHSDLEYTWTPKNAASGAGASIYSITQHGRIRINQNANTMAQGEDYVFVLTVCDQGKPPLCSTTEVTMIYREVATTTTTVSPGSWPDGWWDDEANLTVFIIGCILAAVALGLLAYLLYNYWGRFNCKTKNCCKPKPKPRTVKPKPAPERQRFNFWNEDPNSNRADPGALQNKQMPEIANQRAAPPPKLMHPPTNMSTWMP